MGTSKKRRTESESEEEGEFDGLEIDGSSSEEEEDEDEELGGGETDKDDESGEGEGSEGELEEEVKGGFGGDMKAEVDELAREIQSHRNNEMNILGNLKDRQDEDALKGQAVKNQMALWNLSLEFRLKLQKPFSSSNRLPLGDSKSAFCDSVEGVSTAYADLMTSSKQTLEALLDLQKALLENNPSISESPNGGSSLLEKKQLKGSNSVDMEGDEEWIQISQMHRRIASFRDKSINKWQRKTQVTTGATAMKHKLQAFNQNISEQVATYMRDPSRMLKQMQLRRSTVGPFGQVPKQMDGEPGKENPDLDPELLDDTEFYQQLLKEFLESANPNAAESAFYALKSSQNKKRKLVDRRASKSRKIRYNVHEKIANFMAPRPIKLPLMAPKLFENLFGLKTQNQSFAA